MSETRRSWRRASLAAIGLLLGLALLPTGAGAVTLYVSNFSAGSVSVFGIGADGIPAPVACDPATICKGGVGGAVAVDPTASHVYVANDNNPGSVSAFSIGPGGVLAPIACDPATTCKTGASSEGIAIAPDGGHLYVTNEGGDSVSVFSIGAGGVPAPVTCDPATVCKAGDGPVGVAVDPTGTHLYTANNNDDSVSVFSIGAGGVLAPVACDPATICKTGGNPNGIAITPDGGHLYVANSTGSVSVFSIGAGGVPAPVVCDPATICKAGTNPVPLAIDPSGRHVFVANNNGNSVSGFTIGAGGVLAPVTCDPATICKTDTAPDGLAIEPSGAHLYTSNNNASSVSAFSVGPTGVLAPVTCDPATTCKTDGFPDFLSAAISPDRGPAAAFAATPGRSGSPTSFDASASSSPDYPITAYAWDFGDGQTTTTTAPAATHTYARPGSYTVALRLTDQAGCSTDRIFTGQTVSCNGSAKAASTHAVAVAALTAGSIAGLRMAPSTIVAAPRGPSVTAAARKPRKFGGVVSYRDSQPATTTFTVQRAVAGRRQGRRCVKRTRKNRGRRHCTRFVKAGSFRHADSAGANRFRFTGRVGGRKLKPRKYRLRAVPRNAAGTGRAKFTRFSVKK